MTSATPNNPYEVKLVNHNTRDTKTYHIDAPLEEFLRDVIDFDLSRTFSDNQKRSIVITANPQRKH